MTWLALLLMAAQPSPPQPMNQHSWITADDFPYEAIAAGAEGRTLLRLRIDPAGRVAECQVERSAGHAALDSAACRLVQRRARFAPARDEQGRAIGGSVRQGITWVLPVSTLPLPQQPGYARVSDPQFREGRIRCRIEVSTAALRPWAEDLCILLFRNRAAGPWSALLRFGRSDLPDARVPEVTAPLVNRSVAEFDILADGEAANCRESLTAEVPGAEAYRLCTLLHSGTVPPLGAAARPESPVAASISVSIHQPQRRPSSRPR